jgi:hypothetical protein
MVSDAVRADPALPVTVASSSSTPSENTPSRAFVVVFCPFDA